MSASVAHIPAPCAQADDIRLYSISIEDNKAQLCEILSSHSFSISQIADIADHLAENSLIVFAFVDYDIPCPDNMSAGEFVEYKLNRVDAYQMLLKIVSLAEFEDFLEMIDVVNYLREFFDNSENFFKSDVIAIAGYRRLDRFYNVVTSTVRNYINENPVLEIKG